MTQAMSRVALYAAVGPELTHYEVDVAAGTLTRRGDVQLPANVSIGAQKGPRIGVQQGPLCVGGKGLSR